MHAKIDATEREDPGVTAYRAAVNALMVYAAVFLALSADLMTRVWSWRRGLTRWDLAALTFFEVSRSIVTAAAIVLLGWLLVRRRERAWRPLTIAIGFASIWHAKALAFEGFPGPRQQTLSLWLRAHEVPGELLSIVFGSPAWALWLATAALIRFSVVFPRPLDTAAIQLPAVQDRQGLMRSSRLAGADIGSVFRRASVALVTRGWLGAGQLGGAAVAWAVVFHIFGEQLWAKVAGAVLLAMATGLIVTNLRAATMASPERQVAHTTRWLVRAARYGSILFALSAAISAVVRGPASFAGVVLLGVAPAVILVCCWMAVQEPAQ